MDLGLLTAALQRSALPVMTRSPEPLAVRLATLLPALERAGAPSDLLLALRGLPPDELVQLVLPVGGGAGRLLAAGQRWPLPPALRQMLAELLAAADSPTAPRAGSPVPAAQPAVPAGVTLGELHAAQRWAAAAPLLSTISGTREPRRSAPAPVLRFEAPLDADPSIDADSLASALLRRIADSGLFFESHLAAWAQGRGDLGSVQREAQRLAHADAQAPATRAATQLAVHDRQAIALHGPAWPGQAFDLLIGREQRDASPGQQPDGAPVYAAQLQLELPHVGRTAVRLRLVGTALSVAIAAERPDAIGPAQAELHEALDARGLQVARLAVQRATEALA